MAALEGIALSGRLFRTPIPAAPGLQRPLRMLFNPLRRNLLALDHADHGAHSVNRWDLFAADVWCGGETDDKNQGNHGALRLVDAGAWATSPPSGARSCLSDKCARRSVARATVEHKIFTGSARQTALSAAVLEGCAVRQALGRAVLDPGCLVSVRLAAIVAKIVKAGRPSAATPWTRK